MYIRFSLVLSVFLSANAFATIQLCARFDDSVEESVVQALQWERPDAFFSDCFSNIYVGQNESTMILKGRDNASYLTVQDHSKQNYILSVPSQSLDEVLDQVCKKVLSCNYRYVPNSMLFDAITQMPKKVKFGNNILEVFETDYRLFDLATHNPLSQKSVNRLVLKSLQCRQDFLNPCSTQMAPLFGDIDSSNQTLAFVLDVSGSINSARCFSMKCYDYMMTSFMSQLKKLHSTARVQIYLYLDIRDKGKKLFPKPVRSIDAIKMMEMLQKMNLVKYTNPKIEMPLGVDYVPTNVFFLDDLVNQEIDQVFIFSDFMDYRHQEAGYPDKKKEIEETLEQWNKQLTLRSYGELRPGSHQFFSDYQNSTYLGHVK